MTNLRKYEHNIYDNSAKFKEPCNFEESPYVARIFLPRAIFENVDIVFIEIYGIH
jgi:hypothetical protein